MKDFQMNPNINSLQQLHQHIQNIHQDYINNYFTWLPPYTESYQRALVYEAARMQLFENDNRPFLQILASLI